MIQCLIDDDVIDGIEAFGDYEAEAARVYWHDVLS